MLIPMADLVTKYKLDDRITGILHVGAHRGEELDAYEEAGPFWVLWVEANPELCAFLETRLERLGIDDRHRVLCEVFNDEAGEVTFNIANNGQSSSILDLGTHLKHHPEVHYVDNVTRDATTLDEWIRGIEMEPSEFDMNFWNLDVQGAELRVIQGGKEALAGCDYIYTEVNAEEVYVGCPLVGELDDYLSDFKRVETSWTPFQWGDAFYIRRSLL